MGFNTASVPRGVIGELKISVEASHMGDHWLWAGRITVRPEMSNPGTGMTLGVRKDEVRKTKTKWDTR